MQGTAQPAAEVSPAPAAQGTDAKAAEPDTATKEKASEPAMVAFAHRVEADLITNPESETQAGKKNSTVKTAAASTPGDPDSDYEVRDMRLYGGVRLHQDPSPGKTKGQDAWCEKLVLHNEGPGRAIIDLYDRQDPKKGELALATPGPPAKVVTEDMYIEGPVLKLNQITDEAQVHGPGKLVQYTDRTLLSDKADDENGKKTGTTETTETGSKPSTKSKEKQTVKTKPNTRAGKVLSDKVPLVITCARRCSFTASRSIPRTGRPPRRYSTRTSAPRWKTACSTAPRS